MMWWLIAAYQCGVTFFDLLNLIVKFILYSFLSVYRIVVPQEMKSVVGEIVLITGTGHGIGKELALQFARLGSKVICLDLNEEWNKQTVAQITKEGGTAVGFWCDVSKREEIKEVSNKIRRQIGDVTILINNAGILKCKPLIKHTQEEIEKIFRVNVFSQFWTIQEWLPTFIAKGRGHIVALSSVAGIMGTPNLTPYSSSKFAITGLMESLIEELRYGNQYPHIKLTRVHPYIVNTGILHSPRIRFPSINRIQSTEECASHIIDGIRKEHEVITIPSFYYYFTKMITMSPRRVQQSVMDFLDVGADSHED